MLRHRFYAPYHCFVVPKKCERWFTLVYFPIPVKKYSYREYRSIFRNPPNAIDDVVSIATSLFKQLAVRLRFIPLNISSIFTMLNLRHLGLNQGEISYTRWPLVRERVVFQWYTYCANRVKVKRRRIMCAQI